jgi:8-oxo-dGTP diphosphatase
MKKRVHVAVGVIFDTSSNSLDSAKILIAKRADHQHQGGLWEFPGGKVESGELVQVALQRELEEELGLLSSIEDMRPLITIPFHYPDKSVLLEVWAVYNAAAFKESMSSESIGKEGQPLVWVDQTELANYEFPAANKAIIDALLLPKQIAISQDSSSPEIILSQVANTLKNNRDIWVQLRAPSLDQMQYTHLAMKLYGICHEAGSKLIWNCPLDWYQVAFADGLHLSNNNFNVANKSLNALLINKSERPIPVSQWLSMACHNLPELELAQELADYVLVSPVHETLSHPRANPLTWSGFKVIADQARIPCYALGGMQKSELENCILLGGQGVAGISAFLTEEANMSVKNLIESNMLDKKVKQKEHQEEKS